MCYFRARKLDFIRHITVHARKYGEALTLKVTSSERIYRGAGL